MEDNYKKMIHLFENVKDNFSAEELHYVLDLIQQYDNCNSPQEADGIEIAILNFCTGKLQKDSQEYA